VDVAADGDWAANWLHVGLLEEDLLGLLTQFAEVALVQALGLEKIGNALVDVHFKFNQTN